MEEDSAEGLGKLVSYLQVDLRSDYERREDGDTNIMRSASSLRTVSAGQMTPVSAPIPS